MKQKQKKKPWLRFRHRVVRNIAYVVLGSYTRLRYRVRVEKFKAQEDRPYLIIMNHQTGLDQFLVGMAFRGPVYYVASEDLFSNGWISRLLSWAVAPIPIKKQTTDVRAVMNCMRVAKEGGTIALAPEGNRTYSGRTVYFKPSIMPLVRKLKLPLAIFRIEGGYGVQPRWSDVVRKGHMTAGVSEVIYPEEYEKFSDAALFERIRSGLWVDETKLPGEFHHKKNAEYLERAMYVCPFCGLSTFESHDDLITCRTCGRQIRHNPDKTLTGVGFTFPHRYVADWYDAQCAYVNTLQLTEPVYAEKPLYTDTAAVSEVILYKNKQLIAENVQMELYGDRMELKGSMAMVIPFADVQAITVLGKNKLNVYYGDKVYQMRGDKRFNALKYVNLCCRYQNITEGNGDDEFLGL